MNHNLWNIKDILSIPTGSSGPKINLRNGATSDYSSLTDSQFLFGSQFWPENTQVMSQDKIFSNRTSGSSQSQEANEPKLVSSYHTKPYLFGDGKDKVKAQCFSSGSAVGVLDRFEEDKNKARDKFKSEILTPGFLLDNIENIKTTVNNIDQSITTGKNDLADFAKTLQQNIASLQVCFAEQFVAMQNELSSQNQMLKEMEDKVAKTGVAVIALSSLMQEGLQQNLEVLRQEQSQAQRILGEHMAHPDSLVSQHRFEQQPVSVRLTDGTVQTSPGLVERFCLVSEEKRYFEGIRLFSATAAPPLHEAVCGLKETEDQAARQLQPAEREDSETCHRNGQGQRNRHFKSKRRALMPPKRSGVGARGRRENQQRCGIGAGGLGENQQRCGVGTTGLSENQQRCGVGARGRREYQQRCGVGAGGLGENQQRCGVGAGGLGENQQRCGVGAGGLGENQQRCGVGARCRNDEQQRCGVVARSLSENQQRCGVGTRVRGENQQRCGVGARGLGENQQRCAVGARDRGENQQKCGVESRGQGESQQPIKHQRRQQTRLTEKEQHDPNRIQTDTVEAEPQKHQQEKEKGTIKSTGEDPFSLWSQDSNSSVCKATALFGNARPACDNSQQEPKAEILSLDRSGVFWELFDPNSDSN